MDPKATLDHAWSCVGSGDYSEALRSLLDYLVWRQRGGAEPEGGDAAADRIKNALFEWNTPDPADEED